MTSLAARKSKKDWNQHGRKIRELFYDRHESLSNVKKIMETEHGFSASRAQYEYYIKSLGQPKNLKREQWKVIRWKVEALRKKQLKVRVKLSGEVLGEDRLQRSSRHALYGQAALIRKTQETIAPLPDCLVIEIQNHDGEWSVYEDEAVVDQANPSASINNLTHEEPAMALQTAESKDCSAQKSVVELEALETIQLCRMHSPGLLESSFEGRESYSSHEVQHSNSSDFTEYGGFTFADLDITNHEHYHSYDGNSQESGDHIDDWSLQVPLNDPFQIPLWYSFLNQSQVQITPSAQSLLRLPTSQSHHNNLAEAGTHLEIARLSQLDPTILAQYLFQDDPMHPSPAIRDMMVNLNSLLPSDFQYNVFRGAENAIVKNTIFDSPLQLAILHSISNDFAGLRDISRQDVLKMLKHQKNFRSQIEEWIQNNSGQRAKCFTDNLFRAAVEASDEEIVDSILNSTKSTIYAIDPNMIVCRFKGNMRKYTPIELAATCGSAGIVKLLINAKADVNKTYEKDERLNWGALELEIGRHIHSRIPIDINIVRTLLVAGGQVRESVLEHALDVGCDNVIRELIPRIPSANHKMYFSCIPIAVKRLRSTDLATDLIRYLLEACASERCMRCPTAYQNGMAGALRSAVRRGNVVLTDLILLWWPVVDTEGCLAAAVRSSKRDLIDRFLTQKSLGDMPTNFGDVSQTEYTRLIHPESTPLAEAIRSGDKDLVREFLNRGSMTYLQKYGHLLAAVFASAEVGNLQLLQGLLRRVPKLERPDLSKALTIAIIRDQCDAASLLLHNGVEDERDFTALCEALGKQNVELVDEILKNTSQLIGEGRILSVLEIAAMRIDKISVIEDLIGCGARTVSHSPVATAVKARNTDLVNLLLDAGCSPNYNPNSIDFYFSDSSPLTVAVEAGDKNIIHQLISRGAEPADTKAFVAAKEIVKTFDTLLRYFFDRYPRGKQGFGGDLLIETLKTNDITMLRKMLAAKFDVHAFCNFVNHSLNALGHAIKYGKEEESALPIIQELLQHYDPNCIVLRTSRNGMLEYSAGSPEEGHKTALLLAIETRKKRIVEFLLENGADVGLPAQRQIKRTPLQLACEIGSFLIVKILIAHGASVNEPASRYHGGTALQMAARSGCVKIARLLLDCGADIHAAPSTFGGRTPLEAAAENGCLDMITLIWEATLEAGTGFNYQQIAKAKELALGNGHRGCAERLDTLQSDLGLVSPWLPDAPFGLWSG